MSWPADNERLSAFASALLGRECHVCEGYDSVTNEPLLMVADGTHLPVLINLEEELVAGVAELDAGLGCRLALKPPMSDSMIERVARAICAVEEPNFDPGANDHGREPPLWTNYIDHARAAIAAMREPTDAMIDAGVAEECDQADALIVADDAAGYPLDVLEARLRLLESYPAIRRQLVDEIVRRKLTMRSTP